MSTAMGINDSGQVTGDAQTVSGSFHPFVYAGGSMLDLGTLGGSNGSGTAINVSGQIAGFAETSSGSTHAFRYSSGTMVDLGVLAGGSFSAGFGIDNNGQVVGFADISGLTDSRAFIYTGGTMHDLNSLVVSGLGGMTLTIADDINDVGQIVGTGCLGDYVSGLPPRSSLDRCVSKSGTGVVTMDVARHGTDDNWRCNAAPSSLISFEHSAALCADRFVIRQRVLL